MRHPILLLISLFTILYSPFIGAPTPDDTLPLRSGADAALGPLNIPALSWTVIGTSTLTPGNSPDIFLQGRSRHTDLYLFRWLRNTSDGTPVFAPPQKIDAPASTKATIFQTPDGTTHALHADGKKITHSILNLSKLALEKQNTITLDKLPSGILSIAAKQNPDGTLTLVFEIGGDSIPAKIPGGNSSSSDWRPYGADGTSTAGLHYRCLWIAKLPSLLKGPPTELRQLTQSTREVIGGMMQITFANLGKTRENSIVAGSRNGIFACYNLGSSTQPQRLFLADESGNLQRHPSVGAGAFSYNDPQTGLSNIIASGEGALYFYKFTGNFAPNGNPIYKSPTTVLQTDANLYAGSLPTLATIDWDGDGALDIIAANSEGFILFFKNAGTTTDPKILPGVRLQTADGKDIHVQAGYSGSVQGTGENRWGYLSATPIDWNNDGTIDLLIGSITGDYQIILNTGNSTTPKLSHPRQLYCDGLPLHGTWRNKPAAAHIFNNNPASSSVSPQRGGPDAPQDPLLASRYSLVATLLITIDDDDQFHLYRRIDDYNVSDAGKLTLPNGKFINTSRDPAGGTGRCKLDLYDWNNDGKLDLVIGVGRRSAIPDKETGYPIPALGTYGAATPLLMLNTGTNENPVFAPPLPFVHKTAGIIIPGGTHERGAVLTELGGGGPNLLTANESGQLFLYRHENISPQKVGPLPRSKK